MQTLLQTAIETKNFTTTKRNIKFHRAVAERFKNWTGWFPGCVVHHWDENPCNNHPLNLGCMTQAEHAKLHTSGRIVSQEARDNMSKAQKGRIVSQETRDKQAKARFGKPKLIKIYLEYENSKYTVKDLAEKFNISYNSLSCAVSLNRSKYKGISYKIIRDTKFTYNFS